MALAFHLCPPHGSVALAFGNPSCPNRPQHPPPAQTSHPPHTCPRVVTWSVVSPTYLASPALHLCPSMAHTLPPQPSCPWPSVTSSPFSTSLALHTSGPPMPHKIHTCFVHTLSVSCYSLLRRYVTLSTLSHSSASLTFHTPGPPMPLNHHSWLVHTPTASHPPPPPVTVR